VPATPLMSYQRVDILNVSLPPQSQLHAQLTSTTPLSKAGSPMAQYTGRNIYVDERPSGGCCVIL